MQDEFETLAGDLKNLEKEFMVRRCFPPNPQLIDSCTDKDYSGKKDSS